MLLAAEVILHVYMLLPVLMTLNSDGNILPAGCSSSLFGPKTPLPFPVRKSNHRKNSLWPQDIIHVSLSDLPALYLRVWTRPVYVNELPNLKT
jgi:hypothetical protein